MVFGEKTVNPTKEYDRASVNPSHYALPGMHRQSHVNMQRHPKFDQNLQKTDFK